MAAFKDIDGREWRLRLTLGLMTEIKETTGVDLGGVAQDTAWVSMLFSDPGKLVSVLWVMCEPQAGDLAPERFAYLFDGPTVEAAGLALVEAIADFFPRRTIALALREKMRAILAEIDQMTVEAINSPPTLSISVGSSGGSSELTPAPSASAS